MSGSRRHSWLYRWALSWFPARPARQRRRSSPLQVEQLESRLTPNNTYLVNVLGDGVPPTGPPTLGVPSDDGNPMHGNLRYVINQAISDHQTDTITFSSSVFMTAAQKTITLNSALEALPLGLINPFGHSAI